MPLNGPRPPSGTDTHAWMTDPQGNDVVNDQPVWVYRSPPPSPPSNPLIPISYRSEEGATYPGSPPSGEFAPEPPSQETPFQAFKHQSLFVEDPYASPAWSRQQSVDQTSLRPSDSASNYAFDGDWDLSNNRIGQTAGPSKFAPTAGPSIHTSGLHTFAEEGEGDAEGMSTMEILRRSGINVGLPSPSTEYREHSGGYGEDVIRASVIGGWSYIDENGTYYSADRFGRTSAAINPHPPDKQSLIAGAARMGGESLDLEYGEAVGEHGMSRPFKDPELINLSMNGTTQPLIKHFRLEAQGRSPPHLRSPKKKRVL